MRPNISGWRLIDRGIVMDHVDKYKAKRYDTAGRSRAFTDIVYRESSEDSVELRNKMKEAERQFDPPSPELSVFYGEMHGHTRMSDGGVDIDDYFCNIRDTAGLDFAALTDHDHGGVGRPTLWADGGAKWEDIKDAVKKYYKKGEFTTLLAYERDSYPFYNNMVIYFKGDEADMVRDVRDGELTEGLLRELISMKK